MIPSNIVSYQFPSCIQFIVKKKIFVSKIPFLFMTLMIPVLTSRGFVAWILTFSGRNPQWAALFWPWCLLWLAYHFTLLCSSQTLPPPTFWLQSDFVTILSSCVFLYGAAALVFCFFFKSSHREKPRSFSDHHGHRSNCFWVYHTHKGRCL